MRVFLSVVLDTDEFKSCATMEELLCQLCKSHVDTFNIEYLEEALGRLKKKKLIEAYKQKRDQFMESTTVLEFQQAIASTAELAVPEGKESVEITVSKKWAKARTLKDVQTLAQMGFDDNHTSFSSFNVVPRSILITWFFQRDLKLSCSKLL